jgi:hypothetical protein
MMFQRYFSIFPRSSFFLFCRFIHLRLLASGLVASQIANIDIINIIVPSQAAQSATHCICIVCVPQARIYSIVSHGAKVCEAIMIFTPLSVVNFTFETVLASP